MSTRVRLIHEHFKIPHTVGHPAELTEEEQRQFLALSPSIKETVQRHNLYYHSSDPRPNTPDRFVIGLHIEDAIYGTFYFGYGGPGEEGDRRAISEDIEQRIMTFAPETVLVLVKASAEVIAERLRREPRSNGVLKEKDIAYILGRFEEGYANSSLRRKIELDTSSSTAARRWTSSSRRASHTLRNKIVSACL